MELTYHLEGEENSKRLQSLSKWKQTKRFMLDLGLVFVWMVTTEKIVSGVPLCHRRGQLHWRCAKVLKRLCMEFHNLGR
ncbi:hypothetical protein HOLleu_29089 [Holothuria leucospilota]|uniref:Uncharacterized protein n=1 Tax=Holothuria leucospilota TaxID=206669 RepID=A0A9Q1BNF0_HOLLE|nr:hypothetical protein HOLleu_29089 [Holothuria leucospilota]